MSISLPADQSWENSLGWRLFMRRVAALQQMTLSRD
jgi:hypothetical protein